MATDQKHFDPTRLVERFTVCDASRDDIPIVAFVDGCQEIKKIVCENSQNLRGQHTSAPEVAPSRHGYTNTPPRPLHATSRAVTLGSAFGIAAADIDEKCGVLRTRCVRRTSNGAMQ